MGHKLVRSKENSKEYKEPLLPLQLRSSAQGRASLLPVLRSIAYWREHHHSSLGSCSDAVTDGTCWKSTCRIARESHWQRGTMPWKWLQSCTRSYQRKLLDAGCCWMPCAAGAEHWRSHSLEDPNAGETTHRRSQVVKKAMLCTAGLWGRRHTQSRSLPREHTGTSTKTKQDKTFCSSILLAPSTGKANIMPAGKGEVFQGLNSIFMEQAITVGLEAERQ